VSKPPDFWRTFERDNNLVIDKQRAPDRGNSPPLIDPPNNPVDLQSLKLIDFHLLRWSAQQRLFIVLGALTSMLKTSAQLRLENLALRQQLAVLRRSAPKRLKLTPADRIFWVWLRRVWTDWKSTLMIVNAETVVAWHRKGFRLF